MHLIQHRSTHSDRLERWLGADAVARVSLAMCNAQQKWYGPPIPVQGVPGGVWATKDGDFVGRIDAGSDLSAADRAEAIVNRMRRRQRARLGGTLIGRRMRGAIASYDEAIAAVFAGGDRHFSFQKTGTTGVVAATNTLWFVGAMPAAGAAAAAAPGGTVPTDATTGSWVFDNPSVGTQHFLFGNPSSTVAANTLLLYDRLFSVTKTMNSTATEAVTGVPTRYQATTDGAADSARGNFLFIECRTVLPATAHNWTTCLYTDQNGNAAATLPSVTGNSANIVNRLDHPTGSWFCPLATGDSGIQQLDQMQCSAAVASGAIDFTIGHPIAWMPCGIANFVCEKDGLTTSVNLRRIFDDACMALLEVNKSATTATTYNGEFSTVRG
jgi:hypothetical protein